VKCRSSIQRYVVVPVTMGPIRPMKASHSPSLLCSSLACGTSKSQSRESRSSAMKPSRVQAVK
jgi:hypothetical protein